MNKYDVRLDLDFYVLKVPKISSLSTTNSAFSYAGPNVWNKLPYEIRCISDILEFKRRLKSYFFDIAFRDIDRIDLFIFREDR